MISRRKFIQVATGSVALAGTAALLPGRARAAAMGPIGPSSLASGTRATTPLVTLPGKKALYMHSDRPPNFETPVSYFNELYTPNDAFFVRWHLANIQEISATDWRLRIGGDAAQKPMELTLNDLKSGYEQVEIAAVCQCSGNRRGLSDPHVAGVEWGYGAMGNAKWKGVRLKDVLAKAGIAKDALEVVMNGYESGVIDKTPDFIKSLPMWKALDENTLLVWEMNGQPIPHLNGGPVRLIVPGWTATYWTKQIASVDIVTKPFGGFWMAKAYRIPTGKFPIVQTFVSQTNDQNTPITEMVVNSLITNLEDGQRVPAGKPVVVKGIAWDAGYGMKMVEVSTDNGQTWREAKLGADAGKFSFRQWSYSFKAPKGAHSIMAMATNNIGQSQTFKLIWNPAGYHNNVVQKINIHVA